jgi:hypothetical protein
VLIPTSPAAPQTCLGCLPGSIVITNTAGMCHNTCCGQAKYNVAIWLICRHLPLHMQAMPTAGSPKAAAAGALGVLGTLGASLLEKTQGVLEQVRPGRPQQLQLWELALQRAACMHNPQGPVVERLRPPRGVCAWAKMMRSCAPERHANTGGGMGCVPGLS